MDTPPHDQHGAQQANHRARCRRGGGVTQVGVAAPEGEAGHLGGMDRARGQRSGYAVSRNLPEDPIGFDVVSMVMENLNRNQNQRVSMVVLEVFLGH